MADESTLPGSLLPVPADCIKPTFDAGYAAGLTVRPDATNGQFTAAQADTVAHAQGAFGIMLHGTPGAGDRALVQYAGVVELTTAQWDAIAGTSGGLTAGTIYYLSAASAGHLTSTAPSATGNADLVMGVATSATGLALLKRPALVSHS